MELRSNSKSDSVFCYRNCNAGGTQTSKQVEREQNAGGKSFFQRLLS